MQVDVFLYVYVYVDRLTERRSINRRILLSFPKPQDNGGFQKNGLSDPYVNVVVAAPRRLGAADSHLSLLRAQLHNACCSI